MTDNLAIKPLLSRRPITNYQLPITNYQLPITNYQNPQLCRYSHHFIFNKNRKRVLYA